MSLAARLFHAVTYSTPRRRTSADEVSYEERSLQRFLGRFGQELDFAGRTVLDVGCGGAVLCAEAARRGAQHVTGVDIKVESGRRYLAEQEPAVRDKVDLVKTTGSLRELGDRRFDVIVSKDSFEHYDDPEGFIHTIASFLEADGRLFIGFGPLWKAPLGGHIHYMTWLPWAHLIFPEAVIFAERRRFRPEESATRWSEVLGGLNQMTYRRFQEIVRESGLEPCYLETNVSDNPAVKAMAVLRRVGPLREYFTQSVHAVLREPK